MSSSAVFANMLAKRIDKQVKPKLMTALTATASQVEEMATAAVAIPTLTYNLLDSTGAAIYADGKITYFCPTPLATTPDVTYERYWGWQELLTAIDYGHREYYKGLWLVLYSTMPYAGEVDERGSFANRPRGQNYFKALKRLVLESLNSKLTTA